MTSRARIISVLFFWVLCSVGLADELHVPSPYPTIQAAIDDCNDGDVVIVDPNTYTGTGNRDIDFDGKAITVRSADPNDPNIVAATVIDSNGTEVEHHRGFHFHSNEGADSILNGFTIINGCHVSGGGIFCEASSPMIRNCTVSGNIANAAGGGVRISGSSSPEISNCTVNGNAADMGGGICCGTNSSPIISHCTISDNFADVEGGGAAFYTLIGEHNLHNCIITGNKACMGGGLFVQYTYNDWCVNNCTISGNKAFDGGAIYGYRPSYITISNSILWANTASNEGDEIYVQGGIVAPRLTVNYSDIERGLAGVYGRLSLDWGPGNFDGDPCFIDPGYWNDNGTPDDANDDFWVYGDYHLQSLAGRWDPNQNQWIADANTSLCIDAGDPDSDWTAELWPHGKCINMGAYGGMPEASMSLSDGGNIADLNNDNSVDYNDLMLLTDEWLCEKVLLSEDIDRNAIVDFIDFAIFADEWFWEE